MIAVERDKKGGAATIKLETRADVVLFYTALVVADAKGVAADVVKQLMTILSE